MVLIPLLCPYCGSDNVGKNGRYANGKQRYICKNKTCSHTTFVENYTYKAHEPGVKESIFEHIVNGNGTRATARLLGISPNTVTNVLKKRKENITNK
jgi:transposase-like protein